MDINLGSAISYWCCIRIEWDNAHKAPSVESVYGYSVKLTWGCSVIQIIKFFCIVYVISQELLYNLQCFTTTFAVSSLLLATTLFYFIFPCQTPAAQGLPLPPAAPLCLVALQMLAGLPLTHFSLAFTDKPFPSWLVDQDVSQSHLSHTIPWKKVSSSFCSTDDIIPCGPGLLQMMTQSLYTVLCFHEVWAEGALRVWTPKSILARTLWQTQVPCACLSRW